MERNDKSSDTISSFLGKKTKHHKKPEENKKSRISYKCLSILDTSAELSSDNLISLDEKYEPNAKNKITGFDDLFVPKFFNDTNYDKNFDKTLANYKKIRAELGSDELAKIYLIDFNRLYEKKKNYY
jgi:hypothetical protein